MITKRTFAAAIILGVTVTGCATIFTGTHDDVTFNSEPEGAAILIEGIEYGETPATISVDKPGLGETYVAFQLDGYEDRTFELRKDFNAVSVLNLASVLGWAIDVATGAVTKYSPRYYDMTLEPEETSYNMGDLQQDAQGNYVLPEGERIVLKDEESGVTVVFE